MKPRPHSLVFCLSVALLTAACAGGPLPEAGTPAPTPDRGATPATDTPTPSPIVTSEHGHDGSDDNVHHETAGPIVAPHYETHHDSHPHDSQDDEHEDPDGPFVHPARGMTFEGFTHFPVDFASLFSMVDRPQPDRFNRGPDILVPFYTHHGRIAVRKWYIYDYTPPPYNKVYAPADCLGYLDSFAPAEATRVIDDYVVHVNTRLSCWLSDSLNLVLSHITLKDEVVRRIQDSSNQMALFEAGEHIGYLYFPYMGPDENAHSLDFELFDFNRNSGKVSDPEHFLNTGANPLDYFVDELREQLIELYEPIYESYLRKGTVPFSDITDSRGNINVAGTLEGLWFHNDLPSEHLPVRGAYWDMLSFVAVDNLHAETFWRVLEHPWNVENNFAGLFNEWDHGSGPPDPPLYEGGPFGLDHFYLLDGDLSDGLAMVIQGWMWDPFEGDHDSNHPSLGERRYLLFQVRPAEDIRQEALRIQGFKTEEEARAGFTEAALEYRRDPYIIPE